MHFFTGPWAFRYIIIFVVVQTWDPTTYSFIFSFLSILIINILQAWPLSLMVFSKVCFFLFFVFIILRICRNAIYEKIIWFNHFRLVNIELSLIFGNFSGIWTNLLSQWGLGVPLRSFSWGRIPEPDVLCSMWLHLVKIFPPVGQTSPLLWQRTWENSLYERHVYSDSRFHRLQQWSFGSADSWPVWVIW